MEKRRFFSVEEVKEYQLDKDAEKVEELKPEALSGSKERAKQPSKSFQKKAADKQELPKRTLIPY